jgi:hypothetical protein
MPDNYDEAVKKRLSSTEARLKKLGMEEFANQHFKQQIEEGLLVEVSREEANKHPQKDSACTCS